MHASDFIEILLQCGVVIKIRYYVFSEHALENLDAGMAWR